MAGRRKLVPAQLQMRGEFATNAKTKGVQQKGSAKQKSQIVMLTYVIFPSALFATTRPDLTGHYDRATCVTVQLFARNIMLHKIILNSLIFILCVSA